MTTIQSIIESAWENRALLSEAKTVETIEFVIEELDKGRLRVAEPLADGSWQVNNWIKKAVILYFPTRKMETFHAGPMEFHDKMPLKRIMLNWEYVLYLTVWQDTELLSPLG